MRWFYLSLVSVLLFASLDAAACRSVRKKLVQTWKINGFELKADVTQGFKDAMNDALTRMISGASMSFAGDETYQTQWANKTESGYWSLNKKEKTITTRMDKQAPSKIKIHRIKKKSMTLEMVTDEGMAVILYLVAP